MQRARRQPKTAEETALEKRQTIALNKQIEEEEQRLKLLSRGKFGKASLLSGAPRTTSQAAGAAKPKTTTSLIGGPRVTAGYAGGTRSARV